MPYMICKKCGGYYELQGDESPENFKRCQCGGQLVYSETLKKPGIKNITINNIKNIENIKNIKFYGILSAIIILIILGASYFVFFSQELSSTTHTASSVLASESRGIITKDVITPLNATNGSKKTIAVVTGMHPREKLSIGTVSEMVNHYSLSSNEEIIHYSVNVTANPDNYVTGRSNGESLVAQYIIPDVKKSDVDMVIICHDHGPGYGKWYYVATPKMDSPSVAMGELIEEKLPEFTYYRSSTSAEHGSSTTTVSIPFANLGIPTLVFEMPEWASSKQAYQEAKKLIQLGFQRISA